MAAIAKSFPGAVECRVVALLLGVASVSAVAADAAPGYPNRPLRLVVPFAAGGNADIVGRVIAHKLSERLGQNVVVDNRVSAGSIIGTELVAKAPPDGYTLLLIALSHATNPAFVARLPYDALKDFAPISLVASTPLMMMTYPGFRNSWYTLLSLGDTLLLVGATQRVPFDVRKAFDPVAHLTAQPYILLVGLNLPAKNMKELIAYSATQTLTYGSSGIGGTVHIGMEQLAKITGAKFLHVPYKGTAPSIIGVIGGEIHMVPGSSIASIAAIKTGKVRGLAAMGLTRVASLPDLPTVAEQGWPGYKLTNRYGLAAPAGTPRAVVATLIVGRVIAHKLSERLGQNVVVDNRVSAGSIIGTELVAKAPPDGYTLLLIALSHATNPAFVARLPYKATVQSTADVMGGQIELTYSTFTFALPQVKSGKLRGLAMTGALRSPMAPQIPTVAETLPGYEMGQWNGILAPAGTPPPIIARLNKDIVAAMKSPDVIERYAGLGGEPRTSTPDELAQYIKSEMAKWTKVAQAQKIRVDLTR